MAVSSRPLSNNSSAKAKKPSLPRKTSYPTGVVGDPALMYDPPKNCLCRDKRAKPDNKVFTPQSANGSKLSNGQNAPINLDFVKSTVTRSLPTFIGSMRPCVCEACTCGMHHCLKKEQPARYGPDLKTTYRDEYIPYRPQTAPRIREIDFKPAAPIPLDDRTIYTEAYVPQKMFPQRARSPRQAPEMRPFLGSTSYQTDFIPKRMPYRMQKMEQAAHPGPSNAKTGKSMYMTTYTEKPIEPQPPAGPKPQESSSGGGFYGNTRYRSDYTPYDPQNKNKAFMPVRHGDVWATAGPIDYNSQYYGAYTPKKADHCRVHDIPKRLFSPRCRYTQDPQCGEYNCHVHPKAA